MEVADFVSTAGNLDASHVLTWVSHTGDQYGRHYRYGCATYYPNATAASSYSIAATVTNTRVAPLTTAGALGPVSADAPGGSLVVFSYPATVYPFNQIPTGANDLVYTTAGFYANTGTTASPIYAPFTIRNPRFLQLNSAVTAASPQTGVPAFDFLYADDNGAFDLTYVTAQKAFIAPPGRLQFKTTDYAAMTSPAVGVTGTPARARLAFVPTCVQIVGSSTTYPRYLITQSYSQGELGGAAGQAKLGGEIFEVDGDTTAGTEAPVGGFGGSTLSHPALTGPLTQPTFGVRLP